MARELREHVGRGLLPWAGCTSNVRGEELPCCAFVPAPAPTAPERGRAAFPPSQAAPPAPGAPVTASSHVGEPRGRREPLETFGVLVHPVAPSAPSALLREAGGGGRVRGNSGPERRANPKGSKRGRALSRSCFLRPVISRGAGGGRCRLCAGASPAHPDWSWPTLATVGFWRPAWGPCGAWGRGSQATALGAGEAPARWRAGGPRVGGRAQRPGPERPVARAGSQVTVLPGPRSKALGSGLVKSDSPSLKSVLTLDLYSHSSPRAASDPTWGGEI